MRAGEPSVAPGRTVEVDGFGGPMGGDGREEQGAHATGFEGARWFCGGRVNGCRQERKKENRNGMDWLVVGGIFGRGQPVLLRFARERIGESTYADSQV